MLNDAMKQALQALQTVSSAAIVGREIVMVVDGDIQAQNMWNQLLRAQDKVCTKYKFKCRIGKMKMEFPMTGGSIIIRKANTLHNRGKIFAAGSNKITGKRATGIVIDEVPFKGGR
jgi:hypothetical protein